MIKSLSLQAELAQEFGSCVFDVTLDCEDGAPVGGERDHALMVAELANKVFSDSKRLAANFQPRVAARVHPVDHPAFNQDLEVIVGGAGAALCHLMVPKVETLGDVERAVQCVDREALRSARTFPLPIHVLIESPAAVHHVFEIAAHPRVQSVSFGLMDFVSAHGGAIAASAMSVSSASNPLELDQFNHPLVIRAKLEIASACHAFGKVPSHCVVTEFKDAVLVETAARHAYRKFGFTRMWSIHPNQIRPILSAFAPQMHEIEMASKIVRAAVAARWAPISFEGKLHDRASFRYFWQVLERAHQTGRMHTDDEAQIFFKKQPGPGAFHRAH
jgi:citrate lyase subunit beta/citryl-CoA lyase